MCLLTWFVSKSNIYNKRKYVANFLGKLNILLCFTHICTYARTHTHLYRLGALLCKLLKTVVRNKIEFVTYYTVHYVNYVLLFCIVNVRQRIQRLIFSLYLFWANNYNFMIQNITGLRKLIIVILKYRTMCVWLPHTTSK